MSGVVQFGRLAGWVLVLAGVVIIVTSLANVLPLLPSILAGIVCVAVGAVLLKVTTRTTLGSSPSDVAWHNNELGRKMVTQTAPRIGLDARGVRIPGAFGMEAVIPWEELHGPKKDSGGGLWKIYPSRRDGEMDERQYCVVNKEVAEAIASHTGCLHKSMTRGEITALDLG
jgi:hypothetical protein